MQNVTSGWHSGAAGYVHKNIYSIEMATSDSTQVSLKVCLWCPVMETSVYSCPVASVCGIGSRSATALTRIKRFTEDEWINEWKCHQILGACLCTPFSSTHMVSICFKSGDCDRHCKSLVVCVVIVPFLCRFGGIRSIVLLRKKKMNSDSVWALSTTKCLGNRHPKFKVPHVLGKFVCMRNSLMTSQHHALHYEVFFTLFPKMTNIRAQINYLLVSSF